MNILVLGSGGREHAFVWKLKQSPLCTNLFVAPGNAGTANICTNLDIAVSNFESIAEASLINNIDLILVGPEEPLVKGIVDFFKANENTKHIKIIGPSKEAAQLEGSKAYSKNFMQRHGVPTATYKEFTNNNFDEGIEYLKNHTLPIVLKADGLAAGKGVLICETTEDAIAEFELMLKHSKFGEASNKVVVEAFLEGIEMSVFVLTDGKNFVLLPEAKDYKRIGEGDTGLNTGGMGAISPVPLMTKSLKQKIIKTIIEPTINGLQKDKLDYKGFVFIGLMINNDEPFVIEYNCRMGDPETEVVIPRLENDLVEMLSATATENLDKISVKEITDAAVAIVAVSGGYPGQYKTGEIIDDTNLEPLVESILFHSSTKLIGNNVVTNGGRVFVAVSYGVNIKDAVKKSNKLLQQIKFNGMNFRKDIGYEFV
ncbi:MAG: phosphoribosylamine--glycine ligase [Ferruginibacter sp.]|nr:phosphoribosylamine--glycine ligase [Ferruginibacter sp.]